MLMLHVDSAQRLVEHDGALANALLPGSFVAGLQERPSTYESPASEIRVVAARLTPIGAFVLLGGVPQAELAQRVITLDELLPARSGIPELRERMFEAPDLGAALDLLERWLLCRRRSAASPHTATLAATGVLLDAQPSLPIGKLARECGMSARRLHELFLREVGLPPKRLSRILRFRRALEQLSRAPRPDLREIALDCGYYDQSHLYRDFRELAGMTPRDYLAAQRDPTEGADVVSG
jgi:AraC-like DNA-binding protein